MCSGYSEIRIIGTILSNKPTSRDCFLLLYTNTFNASYNKIKSTQKICSLERAFVKI